jgi:N-methylhydantoinase B
MRMDLPHNSGFTRPLRISVPEGTVLNPLPPAAVAARALSAYRTANAVIGALAQCVPEHMAAADEGGNALITFAGQDAKRGAWVFTDIHLGAWGGRHDRDGVDGVCNICTNSANTPCEIVELEYPLRILRYGFVQDAAGPGQFRGGLSVTRDYEILADDVMLQVRSDRQTTRPYGLFGGGEGAVASNIVTSKGEQRDLPSKFTTYLRTGDLYRSQLASGGGWGDPLARDPARVARDVRDEKISPAYAAREHGVVMDPATLAIDTEETERRRGTTL